MVHADRRLLFIKDIFCLCLSIDTRGHDVCAYAQCSHFGRKNKKNGVQPEHQKELRKILEDIRLALPQEIVQAQKIINERNRIIEGAKTEAETMIKLSEEKIKLMVSQSEIVKAAQASADSIVNDAKSKAQEIKKSSSEYAVDMMKRLDESVTQSLVEIRKARQALESGREKIEDHN